MITHLKQSYKTAIAMIYDFIIAFVAFGFSLLLRFGNLESEEFGHRLLQGMTIAVVQYATFWLSGFYKGIWRYSSTYDLLRILKGATAAVLVSAVTLFLYERLEGIPRSVFIIDWLILVILLGGGRFAYRIFRDRVGQKSQSSVATKVLIIGAGAGGEQIFREIKRNPTLNMRVIGFLDDDPYKHKRHLHGTPILGGIDSLSDIAVQFEIELIYIAIPSATGEQIRAIFEKVRPTRIPIKTLPKMSDILHGKVGLSQLRDLEVEDILGRKQIHLDAFSIRSMIENKTILITGAGGSIGSEIVRQVTQFGPRHLLLVDSSEFNLYALDMELKEKFPNLSFDIHMADVRDEKAMEAILSLRPDAIFHAAAYKHVPLVEANPIAAVETNIKGTQVVAELAHRYEVPRFVMISTDKAVNPTNVMGASKRVAELVCQNSQKNSGKTKFITVRFGNVLGSSGSVIPLFKKQLDKGGPLTVTHPEVKRYFMSIPEASQLVLQAASIGNGGEIFVLNMGEPIKIVDIARQMITLAGMKEGQDINIDFIGLRPGEKMFEELLLDNESTKETVHPMLRIANAMACNESFANDLADLLAMGVQTPRPRIMGMLKCLVPEYMPQVPITIAENDQAPSIADEALVHSLH